MPVRRDLVARLLGELERTAQELERYRQVDGSRLRADLSLRWTVERGLLAGLSTLFQIAEHILAAHFRRSPETDEGLLVELRDRGASLMLSTRSSVEREDFATSSSTST